MAFVSWGDDHPSVNSHTAQDFTDVWRIGGREVREVVEKLIRRIWSDVQGITLPETFKVMTYHEAMSRVSNLSDYCSPPLTLIVILQSLVLTNLILVLVLRFGDFAPLIEEI